MLLSHWYYDYWSRIIEKLKKEIKIFFYIEIPSHLPIHVIVIIDLKVVKYKAVIIKLLSNGLIFKLRKIIL